MCIMMNLSRLMILARLMILPRLMIFTGLLLLPGQIYTQASNVSVASESTAASSSGSYFKSETGSSVNGSSTNEITANFADVKNITGTVPYHGNGDGVDFKTKQQRATIETTISRWFDESATSPTTIPNYFPEFYLDSNFQAEDLVSSGQETDDVFNCQPCSCSHSKSGRLMANCTYLHLTTVPTGLPEDTWSVDMSYNDLEEFNITSILSYPSLARLKISNNRKFTKISKGFSPITVLPLTHLDLSNNHLTFIEDSSFSALTKLYNLTLRRNNITKISNGTFDGLEQLTILDLSNGTHRFEIGAFDALVNLKLLDLSCICELGYGVKFLPPRLLQPLKNLQYFYIHGSTRKEDAHYPSSSLKQLTSLIGLSVDGMPDRNPFGEDVRSLKNFSHLQIGLGDRCLIKNLTKNFFHNIPHITSFEITSCSPLASISSDAFTGVNLTRVSFSYLANYDLFRAFQDLKQFQHSTLRSLSFVHLYHQGPPCTFLSGGDAVYLQNIDLEELDLSRNRLALLGENFIKKLPSTLKRLTLRHNRFVNDTMTISAFRPLQQLVELDVSYQNIHVSDYSGKCQRSLLHEQAESVHITSRYYSGHDDVHEYDSISRSVNTENMQSLKVEVERKIGNITTDSTPSAEYIKPKPTSDDPRLKVKIVHSTYYNGFGMSIISGKDARNSSVQEIDVSYSFLSSWGQGKLPRNVRRAIFRGNYCQRIAKDFFQTRNGLLYLDVRENFLGPGFASDLNGTVFALLSQTVYLDIRQNLIYELPVQFFKGLQRIQTLKISDNKLGYLNCNFSHMRNLTFLDVSRNSITSISAEVRDHLDSIASSHSLYVDLSLNPLPCTCAMIDVLYWMAQTKVVFVNKHLLKCRFETGQIVAMGDVQSRLSALQKSCASLTLVIVICLCCLAVIGVIFTTAMMYKYRWKLRYWRAIAFAKLVGFTPTVPTTSKYKFDAYILYTEETRDFVIEECIRELEEKRGHKLCFEERNFMPGSLIVSDIVSAVRISTKTVPVVTPGFYKGKYAEYGVNMALVEEVQERRSVVHLCVYHASPVEDMPCDLLRVMKRKTYTEYPPLEQASEDLVNIFWDELSQAIGHTDKATNVCEQIH